MHLLVEIAVALIAVPLGLLIGIGAATWSVEPRKPSKHRPF